MNMSKKTFWIQVVVAIVSLVSAITLGYVYQRNIKVQSGNNESSKIGNPIVTADPYSNAKVNELCDRAGTKVQEKEATLNFDVPTADEDRKTKCPWGLGDNLTPRSSKVATRYEQVLSAQLPQKTVLCGLDIEADQKQFTRQDYFMLTLNGRVLVTDAEFLFQYLQEERVELSKNEEISAYLYDWSRILGMRTPKDRSESTRREYCIGRDITLANCVFGNGEVPKIQLSSKLVRWLGTKNMGPNLRFTLIVTGDQDVEGDCSHSPLKLKVKMKYTDI